MPEKKLFTLEESNELIPQLLEQIPVIQHLMYKMRHDYPDVKKAWAQVRSNGGSVDGASYLSLALRLNYLVSQLESLGCVIKGLEEGLIDFPSIRDGREVYLCWKYPEKAIKFWHELDVGFSGRQSI